LISQSIWKKPNSGISDRELETSRFFRGENSGWVLHVTDTKNIVTAILPPKREVDFAYFGY
jgi:hypothetical protein